MVAELFLRSIEDGSASGLANDDGLVGFESDNALIEVKIELDDNIFRNDDLAP